MSEVTIGNLVHLGVVAVAVVCFTLLGALRVISGEACVSGITGALVGAAPAAVGVAARERNGNGKPPPASG